MYEDYLDENGVKKKRSDKIKKPGSLKFKPPRQLKVRKPKEKKVRVTKQKEPKVLKKTLPVQRSKVRLTMSKKKPIEKKENYIYESSDGGKTVYRRPIQTLNKELVSITETNGLFRYAEFVEIVDLSNKNPVIKKALDNLFLLYYTVRNERKDTP